MGAVSYTQTLTDSIVPIDAESIWTLSYSSDTTIYLTESVKSGAQYLFTYHLKELPYVATAFDKPIVFHPVASADPIPFNERTSGVPVIFSDTSRMSLYSVDKTLGGLSDTVTEV